MESWFKIKGRRARRNKFFLFFSSSIFTDVKCSHWFWLSEEWWKIIDHLESVLMRVTLIVKEIWSACLFLEFNTSMQLFVLLLKNKIWVRLCSELSWQSRRVVPRPLRARRKHLANIWLVICTGRGVLRVLLKSRVVVVST